MSTLAFRSNSQVALFKYELCGQISDGHWENSRPHTHWQDWCRATAIVDPSNPGRDFWTVRDRYNFASKDLLDVVEGRMIGYVRLARAFGLERVKQEDMRWCVGCDGKVEGYSGRKIAPEFIAKVTEALNDTKYIRRNLTKDLKDMGQIIKMYRQQVQAVVNV